MPSATVVRSIETVVASCHRVDVAVGLGVDDPRGAHVLDEVLVLEREVERRRDVRSRHVRSEPDLRPRVVVRMLERAREVERERCCLRAEARSVRVGVEAEAIERHALARRAVVRANETEREAGHVDRREALQRRERTLDLLRERLRGLGRLVAPGQVVDGGRAFLVDRDVDCDVLEDDVVDLLLRVNRGRPPRGELLHGRELEAAPRVNDHVVERDPGEELEIDRAPIDVDARGGHDLGAEARLDPRPIEVVGQRDEGDRHEGDGAEGRDEHAEAPSPESRSGRLRMRRARGPKHRERLQQL